MSDVIIEQLIKRKTPIYQKGISVLLYALALICCFIGFFFSINKIMMLAMLLAAIIIGILSYFYIRNCDIEYEYCYVNGEISIDKIIAKSSRKSIISVDIKEMEIVAPIKSHRLDSFNNHNYKTVKVTSLSNVGRSFVMIVKVENEMVRLEFEPNNKIMDAIYRMAPRKVFAD